jgi:hypothetical protein
MAKKRNTTSWQTIAVVVLVGAMLVGLIGLNFFSSGNITSPSAPTSAPTLSTRDLALTCTTDAATQFHIHPQLNIVVNGQKQVIPANIGITSDCLHPIHTHDDTGTIHVESPEQRDFILGDFFAVWGQPFSKDQILSYKADANHQIIMTVNGRLNTDYENLVLRDLDQIVITYQAKSTTTVSGVKTQGNNQIQITTSPLP